MLGVRLSVSEYDGIARAASRLRAGRYSRRRFLGAAGALAGALLAGCGRDEARRAPESDAGVLRELLRHEEATLAAAAPAAAPAAVRAQDMRHVARLRRELVAIGGAPAPPPAAGEAVSLEASKQQAVFAYVDALPRLSDPRLRVLAMRLAASDAAHLAALRLAAGDEPVPDAFAGFTAAGPA